MRLIPQTIIIRLLDERDMTVAEHDVPRPNIRPVLIVEGVNTYAYRDDGLVGSICWNYKLVSPEQIMVVENV